MREEPDWVRRLRNSDRGDLFVAATVALSWVAIIILSLCGAFK